MLTHTEISQIADLVAVRIMNSIASPIQRWLTLSEAKKYAGVKSDNTIKKWIENGYIHGNRTTGEWRIDRESIDDWFKSFVDSRNG